MAKTDTQISLRVTSQFKARLERQAERERRSVSNLILKVMEEYLEQREQRNAWKPLKFSCIIRRHLEISSIVPMCRVMAGKVG